MKAEDFEKVVEEQRKIEDEILKVKGGIYTDNTDRLSNFKQAADLQGITTKQALGGMLCKHIVVLYNSLNSEQPISMEKWTEWITDSRNYLILLKAILVEEHNG